MQQVICQANTGSQLALVSNWFTPYLIDKKSASYFPDEIADCIFY